MNKAIIAFAVALALSAGAARADGSGEVTMMKSGGPNNPNCEMFQTNGGAAVYGWSINSPFSDSYRDKVSNSYHLRLFGITSTISFDGPIAIQDCPRVIGVVDIQAGP